MSTRATVTCETCGWTGQPSYRSEKQAAYALTRHSCDKHRAQVAYAALRADQEAERERLIDRTPQPCHHKRADHQHGTYVTYTQDRCRCRPCTDAARTYNRQLNRRNVYGRSNLIDAEPAREHVRALMAAGIGLKQITRHTGINGGVMCKLMYGIPDTGRRPSRKILRANAAKILALDPADTTLLAGGATTDATGTVRRLQALIYMGWSIPVLAARAGRERQSLDAVLVGGHDRVTLATARAVADLYDELWDATPPPSVGTTRARRRARDAGWVGPLAWDDDAIDDPAAVPDTGRTKTRRGGTAPRVHAADVEWLLDQEVFTWDGLAARLGAQKATVDQALRRAGRTDLIARLTTNTRGTAA